VRLVKEARRADARRAFAIMGGHDLSSAFDAMDKRIAPLPPKKRRLELRRIGEALHDLSSTPSLLIGLAHGAAIYAIYTVPVEEHPFEIVTSDHSAVFAFMIDNRRGRYMMSLRPIAAIADHMIGRIQERSPYGVAETLTALAFLGRVSLEVAIRFEDEEEVFCAVGSLAAVGRIRVGWGEGTGKRRVYGKFVDWRTVLDRDMMSAEAWGRAEQIGTWVTPSPTHERPATRKLEPDWIERMVGRE
jgi:hypothetical protein